MTNKRLIIIFVCLFFAFAALAVIIGGIQPEENIAIITVNGKFYKEVDITQEETFVVESKKGTNTIEVKDNEISISEATCPDRLCVRHGSLKNKYDAIVCLPNKVVIEYKTSADIDAVAGR